MGSAPETCAACNSSAPTTVSADHVSPPRRPSPAVAITGARTHHIVGGEPTPPSSAALIHRLCINPNTRVCGGVAGAHQRQRRGAEPRHRAHRAAGDRVAEGGDAEPDHRRPRQDEPRHDPDGQRATMRIGVADGAPRFEA